MRPAMRRPHVVVVAGAGGAIGNTVLRERFADARYDRVTVLTTRRFLQMPRRLADVVVSEGAWARALPAMDHAVIVFARVRRSRKAVYWQPARTDLLPLAGLLRAHGARELDVVFEQGRLSADERDALDALGFACVAQHQLTAPMVQQATGNWLERLAGWMIAVLRVSMQQVAATARSRRSAHPPPAFKRR